MTIRRDATRYVLLVVCMLVAAPLQDMAEGATIAGTVTDALGSPIDMVGLDFVDSSAQQSVAATTTAPDDTYAVMVPAATYDIHVSPPIASGFLPQTVFGQVVTGDTTLHFVLVPVVGAEFATYSGQVVDRAGLPAEGVRVRLREVPPGNNGGDAFTDSKGMFALQVPAGVYNVELRRIGGGASSRCHPCPRAISRRI